MKLRKLVSAFGLLAVVSLPVIAIAAQKIVTYVTVQGDTINGKAVVPGQRIQVYATVPTTTPPVVVPPTPTSTPTTTPNEVILNNVYLTGYANHDNTPPGSNQTDLGGHTGTTGGNGTYANPTTLAVGGQIINGKEIDDYPYGTIFYIPNVRKYFTAHDFCGDGNNPQAHPCHNLHDPQNPAPAGATAWFDQFVGGGSAVEDNCESDVTGLFTVIVNPPSNLAVVPGDICSTSGVAQQQFGNTIVTQ